MSSYCPDGLAPALSEVADALAGLSRDHWSALEREEFGHVFGCFQYWTAFGLSDTQQMVPQFLLGFHIIRLFTERHPDLVPPPPEEGPTCHRNHSR